jgi:hypothetical protein
MSFTSGYEYRKVYHVDRPSRLWGGTQQTRRPRATATTDEAGEERAEEQPEQQHGENAGQSPERKRYKLLGVRIKVQPGQKVRRFRT